MMNRPTVDEILQGMAKAVDDEEPDHHPNRYTAVMVTAKRARQINSYYRSLGEGSAFDDLAPPIFTSSGRSYLTTAMEEVARGEIAHRLRGRE